MREWYVGLCLALCTLSGSIALAGEGEATGETRIGACRATAAVALSANRFIVASSVDNYLRLYARDGKVEPLQAFDLNGFLAIDSASSEADIQAAAATGGRVYWISSHARDPALPRMPGDLVANEHARFWATQIDFEGERPVLYCVGSPYSRLLDDLLADPRLARFDLATAVGNPSNLPGGFGISGMAAMPDGRLLLGLSGPLWRERAVLIPLENPEELLSGMSAARFGEPMLLNLAGRGVGGIEYWPERNEYVVLASSPDATLPAEIYRWNGLEASKPKKVQTASLSEILPRSVIIYPGNAEQFQVVGDEVSPEPPDSANMLGQTICQQVHDLRLRTFRTVWITP